MQIKEVQRTYDIRHYIKAKSNVLNKLKYLLFSRVGIGIVTKPNKQMIK